MTRAEAYQAFWASFGLEAFEENAVPTGKDAPVFPYLTYSFIEDEFGNQVAEIVNLWYRSSSWVECNDKTNEISTAIGRGGILLPYEGGAIWLQRGSPFAQSMGDNTDDLIRRKYINLTAEFVDAD